MNKIVGATGANREEEAEERHTGQRNQVKEQEGAAFRAANPPSPTPRCDAVILSACILAHCTCRYCIDLGCEGVGCGRRGIK